MPFSENHEKRTAEQEPRFGRLLAVCIAAVIFCGALVWFAGTYLQDCCSFAWISQLGR